MKPTRDLTIAALLAVLFLSSCAPSGGVSLAGTEWELDTIADVAPVEGTRITIAFESEEIRGNNGCNSYFGSYTLNSAGGLQFGVLGQTEMACLEDGVMEQEAAYMQSLGTITKAVREGNQLILQDASGDGILIFTLVSE